MKRWFANLLLRLAFLIFRRYHEQLPKELNEIIWGEITRKNLNPQLAHVADIGFDPNCSTCQSELEEDRARQQTIKRWLKGEIS
jgi:hypothetical protein